MNKRVFFVAALLITSALVVTACAGVSSANNSSATSTSGTSATVTSGASGSLTPSGAVRVGPTWMMTVYSAQAYPNGWHAPAGMHGDWDHMGRGYMAVVFDIAAQNSATPVPGAGTAYAGPVCALRGGWGMMGSSWMGSGYDDWGMMSSGLYRGPVAFMVPTSTRQYTLVCTDRATGQQASWNIGFNQNPHAQTPGGSVLAVSMQQVPTPWMQNWQPSMSQRVAMQWVPFQWMQPWHSPMTVVPTQPIATQSASPERMQSGSPPMPRVSRPPTSTGTRAQPGPQPTTSGTMHSGPSQPAHMPPSMHR